MYTVVSHRPAGAVPGPPVPPGRAFPYVHHPPHHPAGRNLPPAGDRRLVLVRFRRRRTRLGAWTLAGWEWFMGGRDIRVLHDDPVTAFRSWHARWRRPGSPRR